MEDTLSINFKEITGIHPLGDSDDARSTVTGVLDALGWRSLAASMPPDILLEAVQNEHDKKVGELTRAVEMLEGQKKKAKAERDRVQSQAHEAEQLIAAIKASRKVIRAKEQKELKEYLQKWLSELTWVGDENG